MADLSKLSDQELLSLHAQVKSQPKVDLSKLSDAELLNLHAQVSAPKEEPGLVSDMIDGTLGDSDAAGRIGKRAVDAVGTVGRFVDRFTGAPVRAAIGAAQSGNNPIPAYAHQFGSDPENAPTGKQIAQKAGVPDTALSDVLPSLYYDKNSTGYGLKKGGAFDPTASGVAGVGIDLAADPRILAGAAFKGIKGAANVIGPAGAEATKAATVVSDGASRFAQIPKPNADEITAATRTLGAEPTAGMLSANKSTQMLEDTLERSPTIAGSKALADKSKVYDSLKNAIGESTSDRAKLGAYDVGNEVKNGLVAKVQEKLMPLKMSYDELAESTRHMELNPKGLIASADSLRRNPIAKFEVPEASIFNKAADNIEKATSVDDLRALEKQAQSALRKGDLSGGERAAYGTVVDTLKRAQDRHILRASVANSATPAQGLVLGKDIVGQLKDTNKGYRSLMEVVEQINPGIKGKGPQGFLDALDDIPNEKIQDKFFNPRNFDKLEAVKEHLPDQFEIMRKSYLDTIVERSSQKGEIVPSKFIANIQDMTPQAKKIIFGENAEKAFSDVKTVLNSLPRIENPSGTAHSTQWSNLFKPSHWPQEATDAYKYMLLKNGKAFDSSTLKTIQSSVSGAASGISKTGVANPDLYKNISNAAASDDTPNKGPAKWASDGAQKLLKHDPDSQSLLQKVKDDPKGKDLLIAASDLSPGSKAMGALLSKIKSRYGKVN